MSDLINEYEKSGLISSTLWYKKFTCGECSYFTGEECDGYKYEGSERYVDSIACSEFVEQT